MSNKNRRLDRRLISVAVSVVAAAGALVALPANSGANAARPHVKHCGLFQAGVEWTDAAHIKGHFYSYAVIHMRCHSKHSKTASDPIVIAVLGLHGVAHPYGFTCHVSRPVDSGYCTRGNVHNPAALKDVSWAPEVDCANPDPPYTPATLPSKCHS